MKISKEQRVLINQATSLFSNIYSWLVSFVPIKSFRLQLTNSQSLRGTSNNSTTVGHTSIDDKSHESLRIDPDTSSCCIQIDGPGGVENLRVVPLGNRVTVGYNIPGIPPPFATLPDDLSTLPQDLVLVRIRNFSVNYADVCIRWGLYESALQYVGWPIVPGFDFSGEVEWAGIKTVFQIGDLVFGFTMFGAYSSRLLVPCSQMRVIPTVNQQGREEGRLQQLAALPAVAATALHALSLAGMWPAGRNLSKNKGVLVHSAAGGVGSMLLQMSRLLRCYPIVAVVGSGHKSNACISLGADFVIDKSSENLWSEANRIAHVNGGGYAGIFDANGIETLAQSYEHLSRCGHLVIYGFHTNVPKASSYLSPTAWISMIVRMLKMPKFDPMALVIDSKTVAGFNLSFFADEKQLIDEYLKQIIDWIERGELQLPHVTMFPMKSIGEAHELIQSGKSIGKIVVSVP